MLWSAAGAGAAILGSLEVEACNGCGFSFGSGCSGSSDTNMFGGKKANRRDVVKTVQLWEE